MTKTYIPQSGAEFKKILAGLTGTIAQCVEHLFVVSILNVPLKVSEKIVMF